MTDIKPGKKYFSVVFDVRDPEAFKEVAAKITGALAQELNEQGAKVSACGWGDYATERDALADELQTQGIDPDEVVYDFVSKEIEDVDACAAAVRDITG